MSRKREANPEQLPPCMYVRRGGAAVTLRRYTVELVYRVTVEAPSEEDAVIDARHIVEDDGGDDGAPDPQFTVRRSASPTEGRG